MAQELKEGIIDQAISKLIEERNKNSGKFRD